MPQGRFTDLQIDYHSVSIGGRRNDLVVVHPLNHFAPESSVDSPCLRRSRFQLFDDLGQ